MLMEARGWALKKYSHPPIRLWHRWYLNVTVITETLNTMTTKTTSMEKTNIQVTIETRDKLKSLGQMDDTYDKIINRLLDVNDEQKPEE